MRRLPVLLGLPLLFLAGCGRLFHATPPPEILAGCPAVILNGPYALGPVTFGTLLDRLAAGGLRLDWEAGQGGTGLLRGARYDPVTRVTSRVTLQVGAVPFTDSACPHGATVISDGAINDERLGTRDIMALLSGPVAAATAEQDARKAAKQPSSTTPIAPTRPAPSIMDAPVNATDGNGMDAGPSAQPGPSGQTASPTAPPAPSNVAPSSNLSEIRMPDGSMRDLGPAYGRCMSSDLAAGGSDLAARACLDAELAERDRALNHTYRAVMDGLRPERQQALREDERGWLRARARQCAVPADHGTLDLVASAGCMVGTTIERLDAIERFH